MSARGVLRKLEGGRVAFWCPGCREMHQVTTDQGRHPCWDWNLDFEKPTFSPSILVRGVRLDMPDEELDGILDTYKLPEDRERILADKRINTVCHSFVKNGQIQFLSDCTHALAGQTVPLEPFDE